MKRNKIIHCILLSALCADIQAFSPSDHAACTRPKAGSVTGSCDVKQKRAAGLIVPIDKSQYEVHKWFICLQAAQRLPCGCSADARFSSEFISEWETEISANIATLKKYLSKADMKILDQEQRDWEAATSRSIKIRNSAPAPDGSMHLISTAIANESQYEERSIDLACRVEKMTSPNTESEAILRYRGTKCQALPTKQEIDQCFDIKLVETDQELNRLYEDIRQSLDSSAEKALVSAQRIWIKFRDATCTAEAKAMSHATYSQAECFEAEAQSRINTLKRSFPRKHK